MMPEFPDLERTPSKLEYLDFEMKASFAVLRKSKDVGENRSGGLTTVIEIETRRLRLRQWPQLPPGHPYRRHCLYRLTVAQWTQQGGAHA
jgi:hypothetical protein